MSSKTIVLASEVPASELQEYVWVEKDCKLLQATHTAQSLLEALERQKCRGTSAWWKQFTPVKVVMADKEQKQRWWAVFLQCQECEARLSARIVIAKATASITVVSQSYHKVKKEEVKLKTDLSASPEPPIYGDILHILQIY
jgi:hypothetical protein